MLSSGQKIVFSYPSITELKAFCLILNIYTDMFFYLSNMLTLIL